MKRKRLMKKARPQQLSPQITPVTMVGASFQEEPKVITSFNRVLASGQVIPFRIPQGRLFIITDIEFAARGVPENEGVSIIILIGNVAVYSTVATSADNGTVGLSKSLSSGIALRDASDLAVSVGAPERSILIVNLHGYYKNQ